MRSSVSSARFAAIASLGWLMACLVPLMMISPDSAWVAFQEYLDNQPTQTNPYVDVFTVPIDGGTTTKVIDAQNYAFTYEFTADSSRVVSTADVALGYGLYSVAPSGGVA